MGRCVERGGDDGKEMRGGREKSVIHLSQGYLVGGRCRGVG